jgi:hypothetical protein
MTSGLEICRLGVFKGRIGAEWGMIQTDIVIILLLIAGITLQIVLSRTLGQIVTGGVNHLDSTLAEALKKTMSELPNQLQNISMDLPEPPNPIQALIMQVVQSKLQAEPGQVKEILRDNAGKFISEDTS